MSSLMRAARLTVVATLVATVAIPFTGAVASASPGDCANGANGFVDISDTQTGTVVRTTGKFKNGEEIKLETGTIQGATRGWAHLTGPISADLNESVWMDWSQDGGRSWLQCGPFHPANGAHSVTSAAKQTSTSPGWKFRACGWLFGGAHCTGWW